MCILKILFHVMSHINIWLTQERVPFHIIMGRVLVQISLHIHTLWSESYTMAVYKSMRPFPTASLSTYDIFAWHVTYIEYIFVLATFHHLDVFITVKCVQTKLAVHCCTMWHFCSCKTRTDKYRNFDIIIHIVSRLISIDDGCDTLNPGFVCECFFYPLQYLYSITCFF